MSRTKEHLLDELYKARKILGNQPRYALRNMIKALKIHPWLNDENDKKRLAAAELALEWWEIYVDVRP